MDTIENIKKLEQEVDDLESTLLSSAEQAKAELMAHKEGFWMEYAATNGYGWLLTCRERGGYGGDPITYDREIRYVKVLAVAKHSNGTLFCMVEYCDCPDDKESALDLISAQECWVYDHSIPIVDNRPHSDRYHLKPGTTPKVYFRSYADDKIPHVHKMSDIYFNFNEAMKKIEEWYHTYGIHKK